MAAVGKRGCDAQFTRSSWIFRRRHLLQLTVAAPRAPAALPIAGVETATGRTEPSGLEIDR